MEREPLRPKRPPNTLILWDDSGPSATSSPSLLESDGANTWFGIFETPAEPGEATASHSSQTGKMGSLALIISDLLMEPSYQPSNDLAAESSPIDFEEGGTDGIDAEMSTESAGSLEGGYSAVLAGFAIQSTAAQLGGAESGMASGSFVGGSAEGGGGGEEDSLEFASVAV